MNLRVLRLLQLAGLALALVGLVGFWLTRDVQKVDLSDEQLGVIGIDPKDKETFHASFLVAGRDYDIAGYASPCRTVDGRCVRDRVGKFRYGNRTDTMIYLNIVGDDIRMIALPRDIYLPQWQAKLNEMYGYQGAEGLKAAVEDIINLPVDYYAVVNIDIFKDFVDALDGVDVNIPYDMYYEDAAAGLVIDFDEGPAHLDGEDAAKFVRYRNTYRGDIDRIDNVKRLAHAVLARVKALNVRTAFKLPELSSAFLNNTETNASPALIQKLLPRLANLNIKAATLPTVEVEGTTRLRLDEDEVEDFLANVFGGKARLFVEAPDATLLITNRSGKAGLEDAYRARLIAMGVPPDRILTREGSADPSPTLVLSRAEHWRDADYYTSLLRTGKQQVDRFDVVDGEPVDIELVLGQSAAPLGGTYPAPATLDAVQTPGR